MDFEIVIGFEVHTELKTNSKVWCGCSTAFGAPPNTNVCPVCLGMPGSLPVLNGKAFDLSLKTALAMNCKIPDVASFDRKNYYYPDLPKNYQISQNDRFIGTDGWIDVGQPDGTVKRIGIDNIHLEEDAGKNIHPEGRAVDYSLVDLNRAGTPLLEIVTRPDLRSREEAAAFMNAMRTLLQYLDVSDCKMQEGSLRFELNMSLRKPGSTEYGQKVEVKNLNSMSVVLKCIDAEYERQADILEEGGRVAQETRLWDEARSETRSMRSKETANDYRYFPDPDLVDYTITAEKQAEISKDLPELPLARRQRFMDEFELSPYDAGVLTSHIATANYFERAVASHRNPKGICNWIMSEVLAWLNKQPEDTTIDDFPVSAENLAGLVALIDKETITGKIAKQVFPLMVETGKEASVLVEEKGLKPLDDSSLEPIVDEVLAEMSKVAEDLKGGKEKAMGALMGGVMRKTKGKANPAVVTPMIRKKLGLE
ncbi:MAG: Asp-tRNA(Asn)/Glu-tRNA(Gln) amidotransferase subunit GatB [Candidatus Sumerlaeia bacterium]|nr:Asp-tRNA(Asn)/Glu-tRNA(Gln) amidotransferase subunit GatB [Candidatus Sumerlaeia bacterium]